MILLNNISPLGDEYIIPSPILNNYEGEIPKERTGHQRQDLYTVYFKDLDGNFNLQTSLDDSYNSNLKTYISGNNTKFDLLDESGNILRENINLGSIPINKFNNGFNSQKKYKIRAYDNTIGKDGPKTPNYSEVIFYAVRDNTAPNMLSNETDFNKGIQKLLKFDNTTTVWDTNVDSNDVSKFIRATSSQNLKSELKDIGIGSGPNYAYYNAGIPLGGGTEIQIEKSDDKNSYSDVFKYNDRFINELSRDKKFEKVDGDRTNGYRKYTTKFLTNGTPGKICDNVGNCLSPKLDFRVVANTLSVDKSYLNLSLETGKTKVFANGKDKYIVETQLKDMFGNAIVGVKAEENGNKVIKKANITFNFNNGLYYDQLNLSGNKGAQATDLLPEKNDISDTGNLNTTNKIYFEEEAENGNMANLGTYKFDIRSKVPSVGAYPYLSETGTLKLININPKAIAGNTDGVGFYPSSVDKALGLFDKNNNLNGTSNLIITNTLFMNNSSPNEDLNDSEKDNYGKISFNTKNTIYNDFPNKKLEFNFASPIAYGGKDFTLSKLLASTMTEDTHTKIFYNLGGIIESDTKLTEYFLPAYNSDKFTPGFFGIYDNNDTDISSGRTLNPDFLPSGKKYTIKTKPLKNSYEVGKPYNMGYVSYLKYKIDGQDITIPSISRNVKNNIKDTNEKLSSYYYFPLKDENGYKVGSGNYVIIGDSVLNSGLASALGIAITGLTNTNNKLITGDTGGKANVNIATDFTKFDLWSTLKKNIYNYAKSITWSKGDIEITNLNNDLNVNGTYNIKGEKVTFIDGNLKIDCGDICKLDDNLKRTIIVRNGSVYIKSNITTYGKNSQLAIISMNYSGLEQFDFPTNGELDYKSVKGWMFIDPSITNIDASLVSQGPTVSYNGTKIFYKNIDGASLKNQLHIYGGLISLNTIGGSKATNPKCPYIIQNCDQDKARVFDLAIFRRYGLVSGNIYGQDGAKLFPMHSANNSTYIYAFRSGKNNSGLKHDGGNPARVTEADTSGKDGLRFISDKDYIVYPVVVERDPKWSKNPSIFFQIK